MYRAAVRSGGVGGLGVLAGGGFGICSTACRRRGFLAVGLVAGLLHCAVFVGTVMLCEHGGLVDGVEVVVSNLIHTLRLYFTQQPLTQFFRSHLSMLRVQASSTRSSPLRSVRPVSISKSSSSHDIERHVTANRIVSRLPASG